VSCLQAKQAIRGTSAHISDWYVVNKDWFPLLFSRMLFDSDHKARVESRVRDLRSKPEVLEMLLRTGRELLSEMTGLAIADIQPGLHSLNTVIAALRNSSDPESEEPLADLENVHSRYFIEPPSLADRIVSWAGAILSWMSEQ
jgi:hypothetical protein